MLAVRREKHAIEMIPKKKTPKKGTLAEKPGNLVRNEKHEEAKELHDTSPTESKKLDINFRKAGAQRSKGQVAEAWEAARGKRWEASYLRF